MSDIPALRSNQLVSFERFKTVIAQNPSWLENEPREELAGLTKSIIRSTEASVRNEMADEFARVDAALARKNLENWKDLPVPGADAIARAQRAATTDLADGMIDSDDETTLCAEPMQWRLGLGTKPERGPERGLALDLCHEPHRRGAGLADARLHSSAGRVYGLLCAAASVAYTSCPAELPSHKTLPCLLVSYRPLARDFLRREPSREPPRRAQVRDFSS